MSVGIGGFAPQSPARSAERLAAFLLDLSVGLGLLLATVLLAWLWLLWRSDAGDKQPADWAIYVGLTLSTLWLPIWAAFSAICWIYNGQTPGLAVMALRVVGRSGERIGAGRALLRVLVVAGAGGAALITPLLIVVLIAAAAQDTLPLLALLVLVPPLAILSAELATMCLTPERQALHDLIAGTRVVRA
jgi:uncharacterized RDD family membrane protein YckC